MRGQHLEPGLALAEHTPCSLLLGAHLFRLRPRLGLESTLHNGGYDYGDLAGKIDAYDKRRAAIHPYKPRDPARWGDVPFYGWSEDKARQYGVPQRPDFGAFVRAKGFKLD